jgi:hypothetical protein
MKNKKQFVLINVFFILFFTGYIYPQTQCDTLIDFDSMPLVTFGQSINTPGDTIFTLSNIVVTIDSMNWLSGEKGYYQALIDTPKCGFGEGKTIRMKNVSLTFDLNQYNTTAVSFIFMDLGGDENLQVNGGNLYIINSFRSLPPTVAPGITCIVDSIKADDCGGGGLIGRVTLNGNVNELLIAGQELWIDSLCVDLVPTSLPDHSFLNQPQNYILEQNYPNPFNASTRINYSIQKAGFVTLKIFDIVGQEIQTLVHKFQTADEYIINFDANNLPSGIYFYQIQISDPSKNSQQVFTETRKMLLMR